MKKRNIHSITAITLIIVSTTHILVGQTPDTVFFSSKGSILYEGDISNALYYEIGSKNDKKGAVEQFYANSHELYGTYSYSKKGVNGPSKVFFKNGKIKESGKYKNNKKVGTWSLNYENGKKKAALKYDSKKTNNAPLLVEAYNQAGEAMVVDGNGYFKGQDLTFREYMEEGNYQNGVKTGKWTGFKEGRKAYEELYNSEGELVEGTSYTKDGQTLSYTEIDREATFEGGMQNWSNFLKMNLKYPKLAKRKNIQGAVYIQFTVNEEGEIDKIEVASGIGGGCDVEAVRVVSLGQWTPGTHRGQKIKSTIQVRIIFRLR